MTSRLKIKHTSTYNYDKAIGSSYNEARFTPAATSWQIPLESSLTVEAASWQFPFIDYWGTSVRAFEVNRPHAQLVLESISLVEVDAARQPSPQPISWTDLGDPKLRDAFVEYLSPTPSTTPGHEWSALAREAAAGLGPHEAGLAISSLLHSLMTYQPGATGVHTTAAEAWEERQGVCQDYAHLLVGSLRDLGIPARYVSGYLHPTRNAPIGETKVGESHAWVEWWAGAWVGHDPTNDIASGERHVIVGRGRDYGDVPPFKGIVAGSAATTLTVAVEIVRLA
jgi:transglutaminase-like putative cysteine protease